MKVRTRSWIFLLVIVLYVSESEQTNYIWKGTCKVWSPTESAKCWYPPGIPTSEDSITVPPNTNLTFYCPANYTGDDNYFYNVSMPYGPTCGFEISSFQVEPNGYLQVDSYLLLAINSTSFLAPEGTILLFGSLAAIGGEGDLRIAGNLTVMGGNIQVRSMVYIEPLGVIYFQNYAAEALENYLLSPNVTILGSMIFDTGVSNIGYWWFGNSVTIDVYGSLLFNAYTYAFEIVTFTVHEGAELEGYYYLSYFDEEIVNYGTSSLFANFKNYGVVNFGAFVENYHTFNGTCSYLMNYEQAIVESSDTVMNYGSIESMYMSSVQNYNTIYSFSVIEEIINYGLISNKNNSESTYITYIDNYDSVSGILVIYYDLYFTTFFSDADGIIVIDSAELNIQPDYWIYPSYVGSGATYEPCNCYSWQGIPYYVGSPCDIVMERSVLTGTGSINFWYPFTLVDDLIIDISVQYTIGIIGSNDNETSSAYFMYPLGNFTITPSGQLTIQGVMFSKNPSSSPNSFYYYNNYGIMEIDGIHNLTLISFPGSSVTAGTLTYSAPIYMFGNFTVNEKFSSSSIVVLFESASINVLPSGHFSADIEDCGGSLNFQGSFSGKINPCSFSFSLSDFDGHYSYLHLKLRYSQEKLQSFVL